MTLYDQFIYQLRQRRCINQRPISCQLLAIRACDVRVPAVFSLRMPWTFNLQRPIVADVLRIRARVQGVQP